MTPLTVLGYAADAAILGSYTLMARNPKKARLFHLANAIGSIPLIIIGVAAGAWPAVVLSAAFGLIGLQGLK